MTSDSFIVRHATDADIPILRNLIDLSVRGLQHGDYTQAEIDRALATVYGVDTQLIADRTYFVVETVSDHSIVGCGGWSRRRTLFGGDQYQGRADDALDPARDAAKIRAFFVHPDWARRGIGSLILDACETAAISSGFKKLEMGATLTGVPFYRVRGYSEAEHVSVPLADGESLAIVRMEKSVGFQRSNV